MEKYRYDAELDVQFLLTSIAAEMAAVDPSLHKETIKTALKTGGAFCMLFSQEMKDTILGSEALTQEAKTTIGQYRCCPMVVLYEDFIVGLSDDEIKGVTYHELGHIKNGDLNIQVSKPGLQVIGTVENELAADAYASKFVSSELLVSGLTKLIGNIADLSAFYAERFGKTINRSEIFNMLFGQEDFQRRLKALR